MATALDESFDTLAAGATITTTNSAFNAFISTTAPTAQTSPTPLVGANCARFQTATSITSYADALLSGGSRNVVYARYAFCCTALPTANSIISAFMAPGDSAEAGDVQLRTDGSVVIRNSSLTLVINSSTTANTVTGGAAIKLAVNTWYQIEAMLDHTNGKARLQIWAADNTKLYDSGIVTSTQASAVANFRIGMISATINTYYYDAVKLDDAASIGPVGSPPVTATRFRKSGTTWVPVTSLRIP